MEPVSGDPPWNDGPDADEIPSRFSDEPLNASEFDHVFHLAAVYDRGADDERVRLVNVEGSSNHIS